MKRPLALVLILCVLFALADCSSGTGKPGVNNAEAMQGLASGNSYIDCPPAHLSNTDVATAPAENGPIMLNVGGWAASPEESRLVRENLDNFERMHPNIHVQWSPFLGTDYPTKMQSRFADHTVPDVFYLQPRMAPDYISSGKLLNLSPYMAKGHVQADSYYFSNTFSCKTGNVYGIPKDFNTLGLFYNKALFQEANVAPPTNTWTWDDMRAAAKKLTKTGEEARRIYGDVQSVYGITLPDSSSRWLAFLFANGGNVLSTDGTRAVFNNQAGVDSLKFYTSFQREDNSSVLASSLVTPWTGDVFDAFGQQRAAMEVEGGWLIQYLQKNFPHTQYGIAPLPLSPSGKRADLIFTNAWAAYSQTPHPEAAWELIKYMSGQEVQESQLKEGFALPSLKKLVNDPYFRANPDLKVLFDSAQNDGYPDNYGPYDLLIHQRLDLAISSVLSGQEDPQSALDNAARQINKVLKH
jgi:multiple sugar transport system substrate-binding protein